MCRTSASCEDQLNGGVYLCLFILTFNTFHHPQLPWRRCRTHWAGSVSMVTESLQGCWFPRTPRSKQYLKNAHKMRFQSWHKNGEMFTKFTFSANEIKMHVLVMAMYGNARSSSKIKKKFPLVSQPLFKSNYKAGGRGEIPSARTPTQDTVLQRSWQKQG